VGVTSVVPSLLGGLLLVANIDQYEWEIMYLCFVEKGLVDPPGRANKKNV
jgi:hypothetical protein